MEVKQKKNIIIVLKIVLLIIAVFVFLGVIFSLEIWSIFSK